MTLERDIAISHSLQRWTLLLAGAAVAALEIALCQDFASEWWLLLLKGAALGAITLSVKWEIDRRPAANSLLPPGWAIALLAGVACLPVLLDPLLRSLLDWGRPLELVLLAMLRNATLGLATMCRWQRCQRTTGMLALFLTLFAAGLGQGPWVLIAVSCVALLGALWLMRCHWEVAVGPAQPGSQQLPRGGVILATALMMLVLGLTALVPSTQTIALPGFMPSSGGVGEEDPHARSGVNDGNAMVPAEDEAHSFAPIESELFLESHEPSLYDVYQDSYGDVIKKNRMEKAVALNQRNVQGHQGKTSQSQRAGQEFSLRRRRPGTKNVPADRLSDAVCYVAGRTPLHLRMEVFDRYEAGEWLPETAYEAGQAVDADERDWMRLRGTPALPVFGRPEVHSLKLLRTYGTVLPLPAHTRRVRIADVARPDMYRWQQEGLLSLDRETMPPMLVVHGQSTAADHRLVARHRLLVPRATSAASTDSLETAETPNIPDPLKAQLTSWIDRWAASVPGGWDQVQAIVDGLRRDFIHDPSFAADETGNEDPLDTFLRLQRGRDYHFATAAAMLLRQMGYETRVVSGFYARPERYDVRSRHTIVLKEDVHFWTEVRLPGVWTPIEPTPGYILLGPPPTFFSRIRDAFSAAVAAVIAHAWLSGVALLILIVLAVQWRRVCDLIQTLARRWWPRSARARAVAAARLIERRAAAVGWRRPPGQTVRRWMRSLKLPPAADPHARLEGLLHWADWGAFAPVETSLRDAQRTRQIETACRLALHQWTISHWKRVKAQVQQHDRAEAVCSRNNVRGSTAVLRQPREERSAASSLETTLS